MKNLYTKLAAVAATSIISLSSLAFGNCEAVQFGIGYRQDSIDWRISDFGVVNPHSKAHLHFRDLEIVLVGGKAKSMFGCSSYGRVSFDYGWVVDGRMKNRVSILNVDDVFHFNNRGLAVVGDYGTLSVKSNKTKGNSYVWDFNIAVGMPIDLCNNEIQFAPMIGFAYDRQHLKFGRSSGRVVFDENDDGFEFSADCFSSSSSSSNCPVCIDCSDSNDSRRRGNTFQTSYWGPWLGFDVFYNSQGCWNLFGEFEVHFGRLQRKIRSHVGVDFADRSCSTKDFWGPTIRIGGNYNFCECWYSEFAVSYLYWMSYGCRDRLYWSSATARFDLGYVF